MRRGVAAMGTDSVSRGAARGEETRAPMLLALRREDAAKACGVSDETFDRYVRPTLPVVRLGSVRVYPVADIERWLAERSEAPADELSRLAA